VITPDSGGFEESIQGTPTRAESLGRETLMVRNDSRDVCKISFKRY
jgi:hypothetical protein